MDRSNFVKGGHYYTLLEVGVKFYLFDCNRRKQRNVKQKALLNIKQFCLLYRQYLFLKYLKGNKRL